MPRPLKHGLHGTPAYRSWAAMRSRCNDPKHQSYNVYGGRGIAYDQRWEDPRVFVGDMGQCPKGMQLDRINTDGHYCKENCRWVTPKQNNNNKRRTPFVNFRGVRISVADLARQIGMSHDMLKSRIRRGWAVEMAVNAPKQRQGKVHG